jgi:hypothetical protein
MFLFSVPAESYRGKYMLCFLDDGDGMDPGTSTLKYKKEIPPPPFPPKK